MLMDICLGLLLQWKPLLFGVITLGYKVINKGYEFTFNMYFTKSTITKTLTWYLAIWGSRHSLGFVWYLNRCQRVLEPIWPTIFYHSISITQFSSLITHHLSLKFSNPFAFITQFPSLTIFHTIWRAHACHSSAFFFFFPAASFFFSLLGWLFGLGFFFYLFLIFLMVRSVLFYYFFFI